MSALNAVIDELKALPPDLLEEAGRFVHRLAERKKADRKSVVRATAGALAGEVGDTLAKAITEGCEGIDPDGW